MKVLNILVALFWFAVVIGLCFGYEPNKALIICSTLISAIYFSNKFFETD